MKFDSKIIKLGNWIYNHPVVYFILSFTWGMMMSFVGAVTALVLLIFGRGGFGVVGHTPAFIFKKERNNAFSIGLFIFVDHIEKDRFNGHEVGHTVQNCMYGPFVLFLVYIPSFVRYWWRTNDKHRYTKDGEFIEYDAVWFEGQATKITNWHIELTELDECTCPPGATDDMINE